MVRTDGTFRANHIAVSLQSDNDASMVATKRESLGGIFVVVKLKMMTSHYPFVASCRNIFPMSGISYIFVNRCFQLGLFFLESSQLSSLS